MSARLMCIPSTKLVLDLRTPNTCFDRFFVWEIYIPLFILFNANYPSNCSMTVYPKCVFKPLLFNSFALYCGDKHILIHGCGVVFRSSVWREGVDRRGSHGRAGRRGATFTSTEWVYSTAVTCPPSCTRCPSRSRTVRNSVSAGFGLKKIHAQIKGKKSHVVSKSFKCSWR